MQDSVTEFSAADNSQSAYSTVALASFIDMFLLLLIGVVAVVDGLRIILTKTAAVGSASAGGWIVLLGGLLIVGTFRLSIKELRSGQDTVAPDTEGRFLLPITALTMLLIYIALIDSLGYMLSTALFMAIYLRVFGKYGVLKIATISIGFALCSSWLWTAMDMMLPQGILPWP